MNNNNVFTYTYPETKSVVISGDIHGDFNKLVHKLYIQYQMTDTLFIVADVQTERTTMDQLLQRLQADKHLVMHWYYGHFHQS